MTAFFVLTDQTVVGPFTGVEMREAALAGILRDDGIVGGSATGPWFRASDIGLFSEKKKPLPHPPDTYVPQYQVRGMPGAFQGPFKLRELIGLAARGMLPAEALLQSDRSEEWIEVRRYRLLAAVLSGSLVLVDGDGKVVLRNVSATDPERSNQVDGARAPIQIALSADMGQATSLARAVCEQDEQTEEPWSAPMVHIGVDPQPPRRPAKLSLLWSALRDRIPDLRPSIPPRLAMQLVCLILVFAGVASAFTYWKQIGLQQPQVIGDWIAVGKSEELPTFGISLKPDGQCVIFNVQGNSWTGDFVWDERNDDQRGFEHIAPFSTVFDQISPTHQSGVIEPTDGYIRLQGFVRESPIIDGHPVRDLFLRRQGDRLRVGYLTSVHWMEDAKTMEAGWMVARLRSSDRPDIAAELRRVERELPVPIHEYGGEQPLHISEAIDAVVQGISTAGDSRTLPLHECLAYSTEVNAAFLLQRLGMPDEARRIYRFEKPNLRHGPSLDGAQIVRYGDFKFFLSAGGRLRYLAWSKEDFAQP